MGIFDNTDPWVANLGSEADRREFSRKAQANIGDATTSTVALTPPVVSGLVLSSVVDGIQLDWNDVGIKDLAFYEVQTSTSEAFVNPTSIRVRQEQYIFRNLDASTTYYIRVRAQNLAGNRGAFSVTLNSTTGLATSAELAVGSTQTIHEVSQSGSPIFSLTTQDGGTETSSNNTSDLTFTVLDADTIIIPRTIIQIEYDSVWGTGGTANNLTIELREDTGSGFSVVDTARIDFKSTIPPSGTPAGKSRYTIPSFTAFRQPGGGSRTYDIQFTANSTGTGSATRLDVDFLSIKLQFIQIKR